MTRRTFTGFAGCDMVVVCKETGKTIWELQGITWEQEKWPHDPTTEWAKGKLVILEAYGDVDRAADIVIRYTNEYQEVYEIRFDNVTIFSTEEGQVWGFDCNKVFEPEVS